MSVQPRPPQSATGQPMNVESQPQKKRTWLYGLLVVLIVLFAAGSLLAIWQMRQLSTTSIAPTAPESRPFAQELVSDPSNEGLVCIAAFSVNQNACDGYCDSDDDCGGGLVCSNNACRNSQCVGEASCVCPTPIPTPTPEPTPTPTPPPLCNDTCSDNSSCPSGLECITGFCRNPECSSESSCVCPEPTPTPTPSPTPTPTLVPTPTPVPLACIDMGYTPSSPVLGESMTFLCSGTGENIDHYEFRYSTNSSAFQDLAEVSPPGSGVSVPLLIDTYGSYLVQCRVCDSPDTSSCTPWTSAGF